MESHQEARMQVRSIVAIWPFHLPRIKLPGWPKLNLHRRAPDIPHAYGKAVATAYLTAMGMNGRPSGDRQCDHCDY